LQLKIWQKTGVFRRSQRKLGNSKVTTVSYTRRLEKLEELLRAQGRANSSPLYFSRLPDVEDADALDGLVAADNIRETDRDRVEFIVRTMIDPPETDDAPVLGDQTTPAISGPCGRSEDASKRFSRRLEYPPLGVV
jgi:hypothetical protein